VTSQNLAFNAVRVDGNSTRLCRELMHMVQSRRSSEILTDLVGYLETRTPRRVMGSPLVGSIGSRSRLAG
jgi:hypothetical protein